MAAIPATVDPTLVAVDQALLERERAQPARGYLGMSSIGKSCERQLWYGFRFAVREEFDAAAVRRFDDGHRAEAVMSERLRMVAGVELHVVDPRTGDQFAVSAHGGHFSGHLDGAIHGLLQAPKVWHVWEHKSVGEPNFAKLAGAVAQVGEKDALAKWNPVYYGQAQAYMAHTGMTRHYLTVSTPGVRDVVSVRTDADAAEAVRIDAKAHRVITSAAPPEPISTNPSWFECKWCPAHALCHGKRVPAVNCRTCVHATPELDGNARWSCAHHRRDLTLAEQRAGCDAHRFIPALVAHSRAVDADPAANWIEYETSAGKRFRNGDPGAGMYSSAELRDAEPAVLGDPMVDTLKQAFGARVVESEALPASSVPAWLVPPSVGRAA